MDLEELTVLLVGNGGREHALAWKLAQSRHVKHIYCCPGNGGTSLTPKTTNVTAVETDKFEDLAVFAQDKGVNLLIPGPEAPLVDGIVDVFQARVPGIRCFGPSKRAARMEGSKTFAKDFMRRYRIPTARFENFRDYDKAQAYLESLDRDVVIKASGLAGGKGVIIPQSRDEARLALEDIMKSRSFGAAGDEVVVEEYLEGDELSILSFSDGHTLRSLPAAQDHKRIYDGDKGPNTGGMGAYAPTKIATKALMEEIHRTILQPTIDGMRREAFPFVGVLFTGLMITKDGPKVLEYNVRFGDPETQTLLPLLQSDLAEIMAACTDRCLDAVDVKIDSGFGATVVVAAGGYPESYAKGTEMHVDEPEADTQIFHAGTTARDGRLVTSGGRVVAATAIAKTLEEAVAKAYKGVDMIKFDGMYYRKDIAHRAFGKSKPHLEAMTYAAAGVSVDAGNELVKRIKADVATTKRPGADAVIGGFGGAMDLHAAGYENGPIIVQAIDGIGTKLQIAFAMGQHDTVGIDLVAMNVNDLIVQGAEPVSFLDYYACSKLNVEAASQFIKGVTEGCRRAGCALVGGETAEMPKMYQVGEYDAAGCATGVVARGRKILPDLESMVEGDVLLGLASNGVHSNGYSLVRRILERNGVSYTDPAPWDRSATVGTSLLTPTRIYVKPLLRVIARDLVKGMAHITGGGLYDNVPRMLPDHLAAQMKVSSWVVPPVFQWLRRAGNVDAREFARTFNTGLGMVLVVSGEKAQAVVGDLTEAGERVFQVGSLVARVDDGCVLEDVEMWD